MEVKILALSEASATVVSNGSHLELTPTLPTLPFPLQTPLPPTSRTTPHPPTIPSLPAQLLLAPI